MHVDAGRRGSEMLVPCLCAAAVFVAGPLVLLAFWLTGDWQQPGLFSYRAAVVGDTLLLPLCVGVLVAVVRDRRLARAPAEPRWTGTAACLGFAAGAGTQLLWLLDDAPETNWTLPRPHHFNAPGWWHAAFFALMGATLAALAVTAARRIRAGRAAAHPAVRRMAGSPWLGVLFGAGMAFAGLVAADNTGSDGQVSLVATTAALAVATVVAIGLLLLGFGTELRESRENLLVGTIGAAGLVALCAAGLDVPAGYAAAMAGCALMIGVALAIPSDGRRPAPGRALAAVLALAGAIAVGVEVAPRDGGAAVASVLLGTLLALLAARARIGSAGDTALAGAAVFYVCGVLVAASWLRATGRDGDDASVAVGASTTLLDAIVIALVRDRFRAFMSQEQSRRAGAAKASRESGDATAPHVWVLLVAFGLSTLVALMLLLVAAAPLTGLEPARSGELNPALGRLLVAGAGLAIAAVAILVATRRDRPPVGKLELDAGIRLRAPVAGTLALLTLAWTAVLLSALETPLQYPLLAAAGAAALAALAFEDVPNSMVRLQLARPAFGTWLLAATNGLAFGAATFWVLTSGLVVAGSPLSASRAVAAALVALLPTAVLAAAAGIANARALRTPYVTEQSPALNAIAQSIMYAAVVLVALGIPVFAAGVLDRERIENAGLATIAALGFWPALIGVFVWVLANNREHARFEGELPLPSHVAAHPPTDEAAEEWNGHRVARLQFHVRFVNRIAGGLLVLGVAWLLLRLL